MQIAWAPEAVRDRYEIFTFIAAENPQAALDFDDKIAESVARLADFPTLGHAGIVAGTRELIFLATYRLIYEVEATTIWILTLVHTSRQWPPE